MNIIKIPQTKFLNEDWSESDGKDYFKKIFYHEKSISLKPEFDFYIKKFGRVYSICPSNSGLSFCLRINDGHFYWEDGGIYVKRLKGKSLQEALDDAIKQMPEEVAFLCVNTCEYISGDPEFDDWFKNLDIFSDKNTQK